ncbi:MAG: hypothetical protein ACR2HX_19450 [Pyrinomonadaceae bacterium]
MTDLSTEEEQEIKQALLKDYATREPLQFIQYEGFVGNTFVYTDPDGDGILRSQTKELLAGSSNIRVLIRDFEDADVVVRLLLKIASTIEQQGSIWPEVYDGRVVPEIKGQLF